MKRSRDWGRLVSFTCVVVAVVLVLVKNGDAGKTLKLPHYEVKFGTWPLMEVSKRQRGSLFKGKGRGLRNFGKALGGGGRRPGPPPSSVSYGPPSTSVSYGPPSTSVSYGPPSGNLVLLNSAKENRGAIHKHLQETLKMYAANSKPLNIPNLPIIVRAPGPNAPPPPPGYRLGPPSLASPGSSSWVAGPPLANAVGPRPTRLSSMLKNAAHSGIFKDTVDTYLGPEYNPAPFPPSGTYTSVLPDGSFVETLVGDDFRSMPRPVAPEDPKPSVPPVLTIGGPLPNNYTLAYATRSVVAVKSPDPFEKSGTAGPGTQEYEVGLDLGKTYEQGYGSKPPPSHPVVITKFQKRGDVHDHHPEKIVEQDLPDSALIMTTNVVYNTPNISAPLGGRTSEAFKEALRDKKKIEKERKKEQPLDAQVKLLGRLFTKLQRLKPPKIAIPEEEAEEGKFVEVGGGWGEPDSDGEWKYIAKSKVDSPVMAVQVQTWSAPEINSRDPDIIESMAEFGKHDVKFAETDEIVHLMETAMNHGTSRISVRDLGSNPQEVNENLLNWIRRHLTIVRDVNGDAHAKGEIIANNQFKQFQTFVTPPFASNGWTPGGPEPYDPKKASRSFSETASAAVNKYEPPPPPL